MIRVEWLDAWSWEARAATHHEISLQETKGLPQVTVGHFVKEDKHGVVIAANYSEWQRTYGNFMIIPKKYITKRKWIR